MPWLVGMTYKCIRTDRHKFTRAIKEESARWAKIIAARKLYVD